MGYGYEYKPRLIGVFISDFDPLEVELKACLASDLEEGWEPYLSPAMTYYPSWIAVMQWFRRPKTEVSA